MAAAPRLFLITPKLADPAAFAPLLEAGVGAADVACVLIRTASGDEQSVKAVARCLAPIAQRREAAALIEAEPRLATRLGLDGVHVTAGGHALGEALAALKPDRIVGAGGLATRDDAMTAGEAGVDYLMFGGPDADEDHDGIAERVAWWAEIFNVPCVGYARRPEFAREIAAAGAEFVGLCEGLWERHDAIGAVLAEVVETIAGEGVR